MMSQKLIVLAGLPGSGKSTLAEGLSRHFSLPLFSVDPIEAAMWRGGLPRDQTGIAAYVIAQTLAEEHLRLGQSVVIDAVNPVEAPRAAWRNLAAKYRTDLAIIECVCADEATHRRRIEARMRAIEGMERDHVGSCRETAHRIRSLDRRKADAGYIGASTWKVARGSDRLSGMRWSASFLCRSAGTVEPFSQL